MEYLHHIKSCSINEKNEAKAPLGLFQNNKICEEMYYLLSENLESGFNMDSDKLRIVGLVEFKNLLRTKKPGMRFFLWGQLLTPTRGTLYYGKALYLRY